MTVTVNGNCKNQTASPPTPLLPRQKKMIVVSYAPRIFNERNICFERNQKFSLEKGSSIAYNVDSTGRPTGLNVFPPN